MRWRIVGREVQSRHISLKNSEGIRKHAGQAAGQGVLVVTKLDRLGRDAADMLATVRLLADMKVEVVVLQLGKTDLTSAGGKLLVMMLAAVAEMERDLMVERTQAGLARAKGKTLGRSSKTTPEQRKAMIEAYTEKVAVSALARQYGVSRATALSVVKENSAL